MTSDPKLIRRCKEHLEAHGCIVFTEPMTTPAAVAAKYGLSASQCSKLLKRFPGTFPCERGATGKRIRRLHVTPELDAWLKGKGRV